MGGSPVDAGTGHFRAASVNADMYSAPHPDESQDLDDVERDMSGSRIKPGMRV
jgi:hypothetical protein